MADIHRDDQHPLSPLEVFVRSYLETAGGVWEEVEPQVYDVLLPGSETDGAGSALATGLARITFDPEALPEHPGSQLASFGTPFINQLLADAVQRGRSAQFYLIGLNLTSHDLPLRARRAVTLPAPWELRIEQVRALHFPQAVFWFQAEFVSDQKEQDILPVAIDLHYGREVRHLDKLMERHRLAEQPAEARPPARCVSIATAYTLARAQALRSIASLARSRNRELHERLDRQIARVRQYYADLRSEMEEERKRAKEKAEALVRIASRQEALTREEQMRETELRQKSALRCQFRLLQLASIQQPKLLLRAKVVSPDHAAIPLELVWDPLEEIIEAPPCPTCQHPSYEFDVSRQGNLVCPACPATASTGPSKKIRGV